MQPNNEDRLHDRPVIVSPAELDEFVLKQLAYQHLLCERGNDTSTEDMSDAVIERALRAIQRGEILITFDPRSESVGLLAAKEYQRHLKSHSTPSATTYQDEGT